MANVDLDEPGVHCPFAKNKGRVGGVVRQTAALATRWIHLRQRNSVGLCLSCGYDLRATRGRCPECGVVPRGIQKEQGAIKQDQVAI